MKVDKKSWQKGYEAGLRQQESQPENTEVLSWHAGVIEGQAAAKKNIGGVVQDFPIGGKHILTITESLNSRRVSTKNEKK